jgi:putative transposase
MVDSIDVHKDVYGIEPICRELPIAPSTHSVAKVRPPSARAQRGAMLRPVLLQLWRDDFEMYGARKLWKAARRAGLDTGRDQVARLMRELDIRGENRSKRVRTTRPGEGGVRHPDSVDREFQVDRPNRLWVTDLTFVPTWSGVAYVRVHRRILTNDRRMAVRAEHADQRSPRRA